MKETDLYMPVKTYFEDRGFLVRSEVRDIDVVAVKENLLVGIELKKGLTVELLTQGTLRQKTCDLVYLAVPKPKRVVKNRSFTNLLYMLKRLELGLLYVDVEKGEVISIIGPNGAGKTTIFNCLTGFYRPSGGVIRYKGEEIQGLPGHLIARKGIVRTF